MDRRINDMVERVNAFLVQKPGLLPLAGLALIVLNFVLQIFPGREAWIAGSHLFLHLGLVVSIIGLLLVNVYRR
jgi:hypothetical protein